MGTNLHQDTPLRSFRRLEGENKIHKLPDEGPGITEVGIYFRYRMKNPECHTSQHNTGRLKNMGKHIKDSKGKRFVP